MLIKPSKLDFIDPTLSRLIEWTENTTGLIFKTSSIYRENDEGVHGQIPVRGYDVSCRVEMIGKAIAKHVNAHWSYDHERPSMPCCLFHDEEPYHLHFQVHPNTVFIR